MFTTTNLFSLFKVMIVPHKITIFVRAVFVIVVSLAAGCLSPAAPVTSKAPPNVIIIYTDDQGYADIGPLGDASRITPNITKLAKGGSLFTNFYVAQPVCSASRAALLTGSYPNRVGVHGAFMPNTGTGLSLDEQTLAEIMQQKNYATGHVGKWHLGDAAKFMPNNQGFDYFFGIPHSNDMWPHHPLQGSVFNFDDLLLFENEQVVQTLDDQTNLTKLLTQKSVAFIEQHAEQPFFLYLAHPQPHVPLFVSDDFAGSTGFGLYADVLAELDWSVGEIIKTLQKNNLTENTLVIFASDNGPWLSYGEHAGVAAPLREGKGTTFEGGVRSPFVVSWPGKIPAGRVVDTPLMNIDLLPTIASIIDAPLPIKPIDGKNAWELLSGRSEQSPQTAYYFYYRDNELQAVRYGDWKLHFPHGYQSLNGKRGGKEGLPVDYDWVTIDTVRLYNLTLDPQESLDVASEHPEVVAVIQQLAQTMRADLGDSLTGAPGLGRRPLGRVSGDAAK